MYYLHFFPLLAGFLQIQMNSASKSKKKWLGSLPLGSTKACVFVEISSAETHYSKIRSCHSKQQWVALRQKATMMLSNLLSGRSQLFFATSISHLQVHDILPHTWKLWCLAFTIPSMLKGEGNHRIPTLACNFGYFTPKSFLLPLVFPSRYLQTVDLWRKNGSTKFR